ncbi:hypothetical protein [Sphingobium sp. HWE2-09]|uniref:hypothetical protein n=1 Tax=Sphingobium sp. HWE2-09 TaxID=3108390 RepID=UPI002DC124CB|nr:hypothetical protein [Sphingobium sp. HWE2-09]
MFDKHGDVRGRDTHKLDIGYAGSSLSHDKRARAIGALAYGPARCFTDVTTICGSLPPAVMSPNLRRSPP